MVDFFKNKSLAIMDFRFWDKKKNKIYYTYSQEIAPCRWVYDGSFDDMIGNSEEEGIWMQFTGYKDISLAENKIYSGDILMGRNDNHYVVASENGAYILYHAKLKDIDGKPLKWGLLSALFESRMKDLLPFFKVIGNIFETPELLEK